MKRADLVAVCLTLSVATGVARGARACVSLYPNFPYDAQAKTAHTFEDALPTRSAYDANADGKPDEFYFYRGGLQVRTELDTDLDGEIDLRAAFDRDGQGVEVLHDVDEIDGAYRFLPRPLTGLATPALFIGDDRPDPYWERKVDGRWTGTFTVTTKGKMGAPTGGFLTYPIKSEFRDGKLARQTTGGIPGLRHYSQTHYINGQVMRSASGPSPDRITSRSSSLWFCGLTFSVIYNDTDDDGAFDERHLYLREKRQNLMAGTQVFQDGAWAEKPEPKPVERVRETIDPTTGLVERQTNYNEDGGFESMYEDTDLDGVFDYRRIAARIEVLRDGQWTGDFTQDYSTPHSTQRIEYRDGVRYQETYTWTDQDGNEASYFTTHLGNGRRVRGANGLPSIWTYRSPETGRVARESRDLDGDGRPDLFIDYERLTIENTQPAGWVQ